jgi:hypothetical protein
MVDGPPPASVIAINPAPLTPEESEELLRLLDEREAFLRSPRQRRLNQLRARQHQLQLNYIAAVERAAVERATAAAAAALAAALAD